VLGEYGLQRFISRVYTDGRVESSVKYPAHMVCSHSTGDNFPRTAANGARTATSSEFPAARPMRIQIDRCLKR
jgi:hypothetical protein